MRAAAEVMRSALADISLKPPVVPIVANVTAEAVQNPDDIKRLLVEQVTGRVRWRESVEWMVGHNVEETLEIGHGNVLSGLARRINKELRATSINSPETVEALCRNSAAA